MGEVVNLNRARKARDKAAAKADAVQNRIRHGRSESERRSADRARDSAARELDGKKRD